MEEQQYAELYKSALYKVSNKDYEGAGKDFREAAILRGKKNPEQGKNDIAFFWFGFCHLHTRNYKPAMAIFTYIVERYEKGEIKKDENYGKAKFNLGLAKLNLQDSVGAKDAFQAALEFGGDETAYGAKAWAEVKKMSTQKVESEQLAKSLPNAWGSNGKASAVMQPPTKTAVRNGMKKK